jgi:arginase
MLSALQILASAPGLIALTLAELNPHNAAADDGLVERFAASFAKAIGAPATAQNPRSAG